MKQHRITGSNRQVSASLYRKKSEMDDPYNNVSASQVRKRGYAKIFETKKAPFKT